MLSVRDVEKLVSMRRCIELQEEAFRAVHENRALNARNSFLYLDKRRAYIKLMGCYVEGTSMTGDTLVVKAIDAFEENPRKYGLPVVLGSLTLFDSSSGLPVCFMDGAYITALRTGAAGGLAAKYLARRDSKTIGVIGTGSTAGFTTRAVIELLPEIKEAKIYSRNAQHRENLAKKIVAASGVSARPVSSALEAVSGADVIVTGTTSATPVLLPGMLTPGQHVNAMGIKTEIDPRIFATSNKLVADSTPIACADGKSSVAIAAGTIKGEADVYADLGELVCGKKPGRTSPAEITLFDSSGVAAQDAVLAAYIYAEAKRAGLGTSVDVYDGLGELLMP